VAQDEQGEAGTTSGQEGEPSALRPGQARRRLPIATRAPFSRLAKRISLARASSLPTPVARPRIETIDTTGARPLKSDLWLRYRSSVYAADHVGTLHLFELAHGRNSF